MKQLIIAAIAVFLCSCSASKHVNYIQDARIDSPERITEDYQLRIKPLDKLTIVVNSKDPELAAPFNTATSFNSLSGAPAGTGQVSATSLQIRTVDEFGKLSMPIIGELECAGKTRTELARDIEQKIKDGRYISDPTVNVQFADLAISVLGEVTKPGQFNIVNDRVSIFDALAMAGDMTIYGVRNNVKVIREVDGKRVVGQVDLTSKDGVMGTPYYYLQQNDIVYVEPNKNKAQTAEINPNRSFWISATSIILSVATLIATITIK